MSQRQLYSQEYPVRCSPAILYEFLATPAGLQEWFADKVDQRDEVMIFVWNGGAPEKADIVAHEPEKLIRYRWSYYDQEEYFEFRIEKTEITNQTVLVISDFAEKNEVKDQMRLWESQIKDLFHRLGS